MRLFTLYIFFWSIFTLLISGENANSSSKKFEYYTVSYGDTLFSIARKFNISVSSIKKINKLSKSNIYTGQRLRISRLEIGSKRRKNMVEELFDWSTYQRKPVLIRSFSLTKERYEPANLYRCSPGTKVQNLATGKVRRFGQITGYGKYVLIENGRNKYSMYTGLEKMLIKKNEKITVHQVIGICGRDLIGIMIVKNGKAYKPGLYLNQL